jgi:hypothetical protein
MLVEAVNTMKKAHVYAQSFLARHVVRLLCIACALWATDVQAAAQTTPAVTKPAAAARLVNAKQGRAIVDAALQEDQPTSRSQDCSHLVNYIYSLAGYDYPYASSFELYAGHPNFRRVRYPQAGDLVAWRGHVGIVLEPRQHTFYSLVRSGLQAEDYQSSYWRSRGKPRFYRYVVDPGSRVEMAQVKHASPPRELATARSSNASDVAEGNEPENSSSKPEIHDASERMPVVANRNDRANKSAEEPIPSSILISAEQRKPTTDEVADGISELSNTTGAVLRTDEPLRLLEPVVIFDELRVERVEIKRDKGWAHLQIQSHVRIAEDGADLKQRHEKTRWELRRSENGWTAIAPAGTRYVPRDAAVRILAAQLAQMTQGEGAAQHDEAIIGQEARIVNLLSALLGK